MKESLPLTTQDTCRCWDAPPQMQVGIVWQCICEGVEYKSEHSLREGGNVTDQSCRALLSPGVAGSAWTDWCCDEDGHLCPLSPLGTWLTHTLTWMLLLGPPAWPQQQPGMA